MIARETKFVPAVAKKVNHRRCHWEVANEKMALECAASNYRMRNLFRAARALVCVDVLLGKVSVAAVRKVAGWLRRFTRLDPRRLFL